MNGIEAPTIIPTDTTAIALLSFGPRCELRVLDDNAGFDVIICAEPGARTPDVAIAHLRVRFDEGIRPHLEALSVVLDG